MLDVILQAYVDSNGVVTWKLEEGYKTYNHVLAEAPVGCVYIIVRVGEKYWAVDPLKSLWSDTLDVAVGDYKEFDTLDAAVAAAVMLNSH